MTLFILMWVCDRKFTRCSLSGRRKCWSQALRSQVMHWLIWCRSDKAIRISDGKRVLIWRKVLNAFWAAN